MKILSWNINSIRLRERAVARALRAHQPDVICLQETKVTDELFPRERFEKLGYRHSVLSGQKNYHGVAILSRLPIRGTEARAPCRHIQATLPGGVELHNIYAPAGGPIPDPELNPKFAHKLSFYRSLTRWFRRRAREAKSSVIVGDLNVAPLPNDVWSHEKLRRVVTHTPVEVAAMDRLQSTCEWVDAVRQFVPETQKLYTWWSYRTPDWKRLDKGRRLDHAWITPGLSPALRAADVLKRLRGWRLPSDHAPVMIELDL